MAESPVVALCVPAYATWDAEFGRDLVYMALESMQARVLSRVITATGTYLADVRTGLAEAAFVGDPPVTHLMFLDCDMRFPADALLRLLSRGLPIVGAGYRVRKPPHNPTPVRDGKCIATTSASSGVEAVDHLGFGCLLVEADVFRKIERPWFEGHEDIFFCRRAREAGFGVYVDHDLSKQIAHTATIAIPTVLPGC